jgi:hypothetical protein
LNSFSTNKRGKIMVKKISYIVSLFAAFIIIGCEEEPVAPTNVSSNKIIGETHIVESMSSAGTDQQITVFKDSSNSEQISGLRKIEIKNSFNSNKEGQSSGVFSIDTKNGTWEGDWTGTSTSSGNTIIAVGYNFDNRDQICEWRYFFPSTLEGKRGTYTAVIYNTRDDDRY